MKPSACVEVIVPDDLEPGLWTPAIYISRSGERRPALLHASGEWRLLPEEHKNSQIYKNRPTRPQNTILREYEFSDPPAANAIAWAVIVTASLFIAGQVILHFLGILG